jgi:hypothetical protein
MMIPVRMFNTYNFCYISMVMTVRMLKTYICCYITMVMTVRMLTTYPFSYITMVMTVRMSKQTGKKLYYLTQDSYPSGMCTLTQFWISCLDTLDFLLPKI